MSITGLVNTFQKFDARDIIAREFTWSEIEDKPDNIDSLVAQMEQLIEAAEDSSVDYLTRADTLKRAKEVFNKVIMAGLKADSDEPTPPDGNDGSAQKPSDGSVIYLDYDWNDIKDVPEGLSEYSVRIAELAARAAKAELLSPRDNLGHTKEIINSVVLQPLKGDFQ